MDFMPDMQFASFIHELRVLVFADGPDDWYAQGLEVDYIAAGCTAEDAMESFGIGLRLTVQKHMELHGNVDMLLCPADGEVWWNFHKHHASHDLHVIRRRLVRSDLMDPALSVLNHLPFDGILFFGVNHV